MQPQVTGILDFGDMIYGPLLLEIATTAEIRGLPADQISQALCTTVAAYDTIYPLKEQEIDLVYEVVLARLAIGTIITGWRRAETPDQSGEAMAKLEASFWDSLINLTSLGRTHIRDNLRRACGFPVYCPVGSSPSEPENIEPLLTKRRQVLGNHLYHFYDKPIHIERGQGVWLYDAQGKAYLDGYNNVPVVGHCHPHVVRAVTRQTAALNTHTRYLYQVILDYAERLAGTLPSDLSVCTFVNSGSEANDIAWRMAKFCDRP